MNKLEHISRNPRSVWQIFNGDGTLQIAYCPKNKKPVLKRLKGLKAKLWLACNNKARSGDISNRLSCQYPQSDVSKIRDILGEWLSPRIGLLKIERSPLNKKDSHPKDNLLRRAAADIFQEAKSVKQLYRKIYQDQWDYHLSKIRSARKQFSDIERTVSYLFRFRHPALKNKSYGQVFREKLSFMKPIKNYSRSLEIGAGSGYLAKEFLDSLKNKDNGAYRTSKYLFLDLSQSLLKAQRRTNTKHRKNLGFLLSNAEVNLPFRDNSFDFIILNEVIADFSVVRLNRDKVLSVIKSPNVTASNRPFYRALRFIRDYEIPIQDAPRRFIFSLGAVRLLEELKRILASNGLCVIVEYGDLNSYPKAVKLKGHKEYSIHFGQLKWVAERLGFKVTIKDLLNFLNFKKNFKTIDSCCLCLLKKILRKKVLKGIPEIPLETDIKRFLGSQHSNFNNIKFLDLEKGILGFKLQDFKVAILEKPS